MYRMYITSKHKNKDYLYMEKPDDLFCHVLGWNSLFMTEGQWNYVFTYFWNWPVTRGCMITYLMTVVVTSLCWFEMTWPRYRQHCLTVPRSCAQLEWAKLYYEGIVGFLSRRNLFSSFGSDGAVGRRFRRCSWQTVPTMQSADGSDGAVGRRFRRCSRPMVPTVQSADCYNSEVGRRFRWFWRGSRPTVPTVPTVQSADGSDGSSSAGGRQCRRQTVQSADSAVGRLCSRPTVQSVDRILTVMYCQCTECTSQVNTKAKITCTWRNLMIYDVMF